MLVAAIVMSVAGQVAGCPPEAQPEWADAPADRKRELLRACPTVVKPLEAVDFASMRSAALIRDELATVSASRGSWAPVAVTLLPAYAILQVGALVFQNNNRPLEKWHLGLIITAGVSLAVSAVWAIVIKAVNTHVDYREAELQNELQVSEAVGSGTAHRRRPY